MPQTDVCADAPLEGYAFAYLDETTKRMIRRGLLKAVAIPGYQVPFASREMPMPCGWGTGGIQVTASILGRDDVLKVIDQGSDDTTNAVSIRDFFRKTTGVATTTHTDEATIIQTRHRIPEQPLTESQILVYQVPLPEPLRWLEPSEQETRTLHALEEYGIMNVKLYEDIVRHGTIATGFDYPVRVAGRYIMSPSPIPRFDNPKMHQCPALQLFGAGREKRLYAIPPIPTWKASISRITPLPCSRGTRPAPSAVPWTPIWMKSSSTIRGTACSYVPIPTVAPAAPPCGTGREARNERLERRPHPVGPEPDPPLRGAYRLP